jgi:hypothetical protein
MSPTIIPIVCGDPILAKRFGEVVFLLSLAGFSVSEQECSIRSNYLKDPAKSVF